ncbi:hypothetical protein [Hyphomicrobium methylovorum]|uniref:hypothetical protein n=1 Tax=Hyphomicrobium methylovorum TaxID=84 RepID=UPI0031B62A4E
MKRFCLVMGALALLAAAAATAATALEEQRGPAPVIGPDGTKAQVQDQSAPAKSEGTEIRIPGLGKLGTLPKMDFGLELLYGAADGGRPANENESPATDDQRDLMIHGTVKHRF